ncbi:TagK domain-containing protein [Variovorax sp. J22R133]|uniref:TagK domain-containing protein n=1 Tax=Variovorax brevis TaxID=3053503 RepID=UPI002578B3B1|nr:TagK domain-containing protein [Variovorax sp. J22R133]MDM0112101.1 TagK domain-containing protein [Variovorax sp. J22R133]
MHAANDPFPEGASLTDLALRLTHSRGAERDAQMLVPAGGVGMGAVLEFGGAPIPQGRASLCRILWNAPDYCWQLLNGDASLVCSVNDVRVMVDRPVQIWPGDVIEVELLRFAVEIAHPSMGKAAQRSSLAALEGLAAVDPATTASPKAASAEDDFDLCDLASLVMPTRQEEESEDPFGVLDIEGVDARPRIDALQGLLGDAPAPAAAPVARPALQVVQSPPRPKPSSSLFDELHDEFVRVVRDPTQLAGRTDWEGFLSSDGEQAPTLDELSEQAESFPLLRDILLPREGIDRVIEDFDPLGTPDLMEPEKSEDVLHLFAPDIAGTARTHVPSLTRQEHHALSPDSHVRIGTRVRNTDEDE